MNRHVWLIVSVAAGCNGWPRFDQPTPEFVPPEGPVELRLVADEAVDGDRADDPANLIAQVDDDAVLGDVFEGLRWSGAMGWEPALGAGETDFDCPIDPVPLTYPSDVDFVRFAHEGGSVCVTVATGLDGEAQPAAVDSDPEARFNCVDGIERPLWEAALYAIGDDDVCPVGTWLNPPDDILPLAIGVRSDAVFFPNVPAGDYALFLAAVCGRYEGATPCNPTFSSDSDAECVPYDLAVAVLPTQAACDELNEQLREAL